MRVIALVLLVCSDCLALSQYLLHYHRTLCTCKRRMRVTSNAAPCDAVHMHAHIEVALCSSFAEARRMDRAARTAASIIQEARSALRAKEEEAERLQQDVVKLREQKVANKAASERSIRIVEEYGG